MGLPTGHSPSVNSPKNIGQFEILGSVRLKTRQGSYIKMIVDVYYPGKSCQLFSISVEKLMRHG